MGQLLILFYAVWFTRRHRHKSLIALHFCFRPSQPWTPCPPPPPCVFAIWRNFSQFPKKNRATHTKINDEVSEVIITWWTIHTCGGKYHQSRKCISNGSCSIEVRVKYKLFWGCICGSSSLARKRPNDWLIFFLSFDPHRKKYIRQLVACLSITPAQTKNAFQFSNWNLLPELITLTLTFNLDWALLLNNVSFSFLIFFPFLQ